MAASKNNCFSVSFSEQEWLRYLFELSNVQARLNNLMKRTVAQVPISGYKRLFRKTYYISINSLAHIMERHYYKISPYPATSKFVIPIATLLSYIRDAAVESPFPVPGSLNLQRVVDTGQIIGYDRDWNPLKSIVILTDKAGNIITAFPREGEIE